MSKKIIRFLYVQKEGIIVGSLWGFLSVFAALGLATKYASLAWYHKLLILPVWLSGFIIKEDIYGWPVILVPILLGALMGVIFDMIYKPKQ